MSGGLCDQCPAASDTLYFIYAIASTFSAILIVSFTLTAVVQRAFGRSIVSGAQRSARFAGWVVTALATQAQIGRTASPNQHAMLRFWYNVLRIFEVNPGASSRLPLLPLLRWQGAALELCGAFS